MASTWQPSAFPQHWVNTRTYQSLLPAAADIPIPHWGFKGCLPEPSNLLSCLLLGSGTGLDVWGKHDFAVSLSCNSSGSPVQARARLPAAFQLSLSGMCASVSGLQPSPSAATQLSICQHKKKRAQFCFSVASLISLSNTCLIFPLLHLLCVQRHTNKEKRPVATAQADSTPKHSTWVWLLDLLQALSFCAAALSPAGTQRGASRPCLPCSPWPRCSG